MKTGEIGCATRTYFPHSPAKFRLLCWIHGRAPFVHTAVPLVLADVVAHITYVFGTSGTVGITRFTQNHPTLVNFIEGRLNPDSTKTLPLPELPLVFELMVTNPKTFGSRGLLRVMQLSDASMPGRLFVQRCTSANVSSSFCKDQCGSRTDSIGNCSTLHALAKRGDFFAHETI